MFYTKISILTLTAIVGLGACSGSVETAENTSDTPQTSEPAITQQLVSEDVDAARFQELIGQGNGLLIDVRTPGEFSAGHIEGAINLDFNGGEFEASLDTLNKQTPVYVYCQSGGRSGKAKNMMNEKGFTEVYNLIGGYGSWPYKGN